MTSPPPTTDEDRAVRPFAAVLQNINAGRTHAELSEKLQELTAAVKATGKKGSLVLRIDLAESKAAGALDLTTSIRATLPQPKQFATIFFVDSDDNLVRTDPNQTELDLGPVRVASDNQTGKAANQ